MDRTPETQHTHSFSDTQQSQLKDIVNSVWDESSFEKAKDIAFVFVSSSVIPIDDRETILDNIENSPNKKDLDQYMANSLLYFEGHTIKRKKKRKKKKLQIYFTLDTQKAIIEYLASDDPEERNKIFNERINYAFYKLAENIIHTFKFYYTEVDHIDELKHEVVCFLMEKLHLYKEEKGKAYSYFGTIAKRYLILYNEKNYKKLKAKTDVSEIDKDDFIYNDLVQKSSLTEESKSSPNQDNVDFFQIYIEYIDKNFYMIFKEKDILIADALLEIFKHRNTIPIIEKKAIYLYIRERTGIDTPQITRVVKKFKKIYDMLYNEYYKYGYINL